MVAISVVYQVLVRQRLLFLQPTVRSMVQTIPPSWLIKHSSVREGDAQVLWDLLNSNTWNCCPERGKNWLDFNCDAMDIDWNEVPVNGVKWHMKIPNIFVEEVGIKERHVKLGSFIRAYKRLRIAS